MQAVLQRRASVDSVVDRIITKVFTGFAKRKLAEFAEEKKDLPAPAIIAEFAERHPLLGRCDLSALLPVLREAEGVPEPESIVQMAGIALQRMKDARARLTEVCSDAAIYEALAAEKLYVAALENAKKYWGWGVAEAAKKAVIGGWLR